MPRVALHTLGCKVNQYETGRIAEEFRSRGFEIVDFRSPADVYVVNTCTVTQTADAKSRQAARSAVQRSPDAVVVVTGCYAETSPDELAAIPGVALVTGNRGKDSLVEQVVALLDVGGIASEDAETSLEVSREAVGRTRALLKIQDGCNQFCSYCAVPLARPNMYCKPLPEVLSEAESLAARGYREIVLTGIRLGLYRDGPADLCGVLEGVARIPSIERIRLSSIELSDVPEGLIELMGRSQNVCRHLHIPLQSGSDAVLGRMNRPYSVSNFIGFVSEARRILPGLAVTTDIMVGFPGETSEEYQSSYYTAGQLEFSRMHVFRYSPRPGTQSAEMSDDVSDAEKQCRSGRLIALARECSQRFASRLVGNTVGVLVEGKTLGANIMSGLTDNYVRVVFQSAPAYAGRLVRVSVESAADGVAKGVIVG